MIEFIPYLTRLHKLASNMNNASSIYSYKREIFSALNGQPAEFLRSNINLSKLRASGAFFTGHKLASKLILPIRKEVQKDTKIFDPACGVGDLLLALAKFLPIYDNLEKTLTYWGSILYGYDIHEEFVKATKLRLLILAQIRCQGSMDIISNLEDLFPNILVKDFLSEKTIMPKVDIILLNPPFNMNVNSKCNWSSGSISCAGLFVAKCIEEGKINSNISAILPDVLRTGTRYQKWRELISKKVEVEMIEIVGKFDTLTDIDVFLMHMHNPANGTNHVDWNLLGQIKRNNKKVKHFGDIFDIRVGPVVPFRDIESGESNPYIDTNEVGPWKIIFPGAKSKKYSKKLYMPPFIVVRRTSKPSDKIRAVASIVVGKRGIAVENHLIILQPKNKSLKHCKRGLEILKSEPASDWLNKRIRCRHLTTMAIAEMPWFETK